MNLQGCQKIDLYDLYEYWLLLEKEVPYFFPVPFQKWQDCVLEDRLENERVFSWLDTHLASEGGTVLGFIQFGNPRFAWDEKGRKIFDPEIGVIRHMFFDSDRLGVGEALLAVATSHLAGYNTIHAFYHILGMSCSAYHGKLHSSQGHVDKLLLKKGFHIEHENKYYVLDISEASLSNKCKDPEVTIHEGPMGDFTFLVTDSVVGKASVRYMGDLTGGAESHIAYLTWFWIAHEYRSLGYGKKFLCDLLEALLCKDYAFVHTDTANDNTIAQGLYRKLGFQERGSTRSYLYRHRNPNKFRRMCRLG